MDIWIGDDMNETLETEREVRRARLLDMRHNQKMTLGAIAKVEQVTSARVGQLIGNTGSIRSLDQTLLKVYRFVDKYQAEHQYAPSFEEIAIAVPAKDGSPTSSSVVRYWLDRMEGLKMIAPRPAKIARALRPLPLDRRNPAIREMLRIEKENQDAK